MSGARSLKITIIQNIQRESILQKAKFPQFKVRDWDYSIPIEYYEKDKEKKEERKRTKLPLLLKFLTI